MLLLEMYEEFRIEFPGITAKADSIHVKQWGSLDPDDAYSWFESLANALNGEMRRGTAPTHYKDLFEYFRKKYLFEDDDIKNCIDVAFTENLFWQVNEEKSAPYWKQLPDTIKSLYKGFHGKSPA
ncbi:hypothetical protein L4C36_18135 [Photobacterium japonica]|uniref:DUF7674 family protein n=1 Tax=Photobacterium japonica TaxID=2910235 RepID=UPI003D0F2809